MKFGDKFRYEEAFNAYCDNIDEDAFKDSPERIARGAMNMITWMTDTPEGKQLVRELYKEVQDGTQ